MPDFHDQLTDPAASGLPERFFDRFMFNMHPTDALEPVVILGGGRYPPKSVADGYVMVVIGDEQRNIRFSSPTDQTSGSRVGPLEWETVEPMRRWRLRLAPNATGLELDVTWEARAPAWFGEVVVGNEEQDDVTSFTHLFQSGHYRGTLTLDGASRSVDGWYGQRDRSRGVRTMSGGQGLHIWYQAQFPERSVGFLLVEGRDNARLLLEGAVMHTDGRIDPILDVEHDLIFDEDLELRGGSVVVLTAGGARLAIDTDPAGRGVYMAGGGYGGHHGRAGGEEVIDADTYRLDGTTSPRSFDTSLTDRLSRFTCDGERGIGIFEFALTRSRSYRYRPSRADRSRQHA
jgi:hypothetical protein